MGTHSKTRALSLLVLIVLLLVPIAGAVSNPGPGPAPTKTASQVAPTKIASQVAPTKTASPVATTSPALNKGTSKEDTLFKKLSAEAELYNKKFDKVPEVIKKLVDSHSALVKINLDNGKVLSIAITTKDGKIETFSKYNPKSKFNPSITVKTDEKTVRAVIDSTNPFKEAFKFLEKGCIKINGENCFIKVVFCTLEKYYGC